MLNGAGLNQAFKMSLPRRARIGASVGEQRGWATGAGAAPAAGKHRSALRPVPSLGRLGLRDPGRHALMPPGHTTLHPPLPGFKASHGAEGSGGRRAECERKLWPRAQLCMRMCVCMCPCVFVCARLRVSMCVCMCGAHANMRVYACTRAGAGPCAPMWRC